MAFQLDSLSYNGWSFDKFVSSRVKATPVYDDARRMIKFVVFTIDLKGYIGADVGNLQTTDDTLEAMKVQLESPGKILKYDSRGYGSFIINDPKVGVWDCDWGPKPGQFNYKPLGSGYGCMFEYTISTAIPVCDGSVYSNALMMANYAVDYSLDEQGLTTITVTGAIEIPLTFRTGLALPDNAEAYRPRCFPAVDIGFQRISQKFTLSADRKRGDFSYTDKEIPIPLPNGCTMCDIKHRVRNVDARTFIRWRNEFSGTVRTNPAIPKITAFDRFLMVLLSRMIYTNNYLSLQPAANQPPQQPDPAPNGQAGPAMLLFGAFGAGWLVGQAIANSVGPLAPKKQIRILPIHMEITENIFGLDSHFTYAYDIFVPNKLSDIVKASAMWRPVGTNFAAWRDSLADNAHAPRGTSGARYLNSEDTLIDLCTPTRIGTVIERRSSSFAGTSAPPGDDEDEVFSDEPDNPEAYASGTSNAQPFSGSSNVAPSPQSLSPSLFDDAPPPPEASWLKYQAMLSYSENNNIAVQKPLAGTVQTTDPTVDPFDQIGVLTETDEPLTGVSASVPDIVQRISAPSVRVMLFGMATRLGYAVQPPELKTFRGQTPTQLNANITQGIVGAVAGVPIYQCNWSILYLVPTPPQGPLPVPANPLYPVALDNTIPNN